jgi:DNA (cytosine-5)-methyltransferase 1
MTDISQTSYQAQSMAHKRHAMRFGSVCSGIEAASVAWHPLGWEAAWLSEIEPFPSAVLKHHYPDVPNLGDMTTLPDRIRAGEVEAPDLFCGGTPCQAFSVAGLRKSLDDARGNLSLTFCEIANAIDDIRLSRGELPAVIFWENVPGVLSTKDNAFGCFLAGLAGDDEPVVHPQGKWKNSGVVVGPERLAVWRVLDAQYFGVAQRRRRVFVLSVSLRHPRAWAIAESLLPLSEGVRGDTAPSREARQSVTHTTAPCLTSSGRGVERTGDTRGQDPVVATWWDGGEVAATKTTKSDDQRMPDKANAQLVMVPAVAHALRGEGFDASEDGTGRGTPLVIAFHPTQDPISSEDVCHSIGANDNATAAVAFAQNQLGEVRVGDVFNTINTNSNASGRNTPMVAVATDLYNGAIDGDVTHSIRVGNGNAMGGVPSVMSTMQVRRLTPTECERLQGFPDNYTNIPWRGKPESPDGPRYKALGNSWAVPVVRWIGSRIDAAVNAVPTAFRKTSDDANVTSSEIYGTKKAQNTFRSVEMPCKSLIQRKAGVGIEPAYTETTPSARPQPAGV